MSLYDYYFNRQKCLYSPSTVFKPQAMNWFQLFMNINKVLFVGLKMIEMRS